MNASSKVFRAGTRKSPLALQQTRTAIALFSEVFPDTRFDPVEISTPGDADRSADLRESPDDFFTRTLDEAVLSGRVDFATHSAKDMPDPVAEGLDWFWLPDAGDRRDGLVGSLRPKIIGVSSDRRAAYAAKRFPNATQLPIRGNIEERIAQVDGGTFDLIIMAGVALQRLGLEKRIAEWIPLEELNPPEAQGVLAVTFRADDERFLRLRSLFVKPVVFVSAGTSAELCTQGIYQLVSPE